ncbi:hypothetical protein Ahy_B08g093758 [Arachis hypogaea]|uniref:Uncharacterized protein n=1 Tax=Arachis hypogaea TaxID=3818 RepID=A0A444Y6X1_ARAHY|nr:hypothetical protein Ahy_B08g093758 [Arachis hypogaea]
MPARSKEMLAEMKKKCYMWVTRVKTYRDGTTNEYEPVCTLKAEEQFILSKVYFASLKAATNIEVENMAIGNHPDGEFLQPKSKKPFKVEDYPMFIPFLDLKKLPSHRYGYVISRMPGVPLRKKDREIEPPYIDISGQKIRDEAIRKSEAIRLSKPSSMLLSPYCQIDSYDIDND